MYKCITEKDTPRILHINCTDDGSTGKIIQVISAEAASRGYESYLLTPRITHKNAKLRKVKTSLRYEQGAYRRLVKLQGFQYGLAPLSTERILAAIRKISPQIVHLHSINCNMVNIYRLVEFLKKNGIPTIVTNHAEFFYTGSCPHSFLCEKWKTGCGSCENYKQSCRALWDSSALAWKKMKKAFSGHPNVHIVSVSPWSFNRSMQAPILKGLPQSTILNGVDTEIFSYGDTKKAKQDLGFDPEEKLLFHVTANFSDDPNDIKGGRYLIELAKQLERQKVRVLVAALRSNVGPLPENITLLDQVQDQNRLADYYAAADLTVLVSQRETFGMAVAESLCCGTPVVGFESGGSESVALPEFTQFVPFGDVAKLKNAVCDKLDLKEEKCPETISKEAVKVYSATRMAESYIQLYKRVMTE